MTQVQTAQNGRSKTSLIEKIADRYNVEPTKLLHTLKQTAFQSAQEITNEQMMALMVVADQYRLNPFTKEIYAFPDQRNGIVPVVGVDGWSRIINENPAFDGMEFKYSENNISDLPGQIHPAPEWCECVIYRKDRTHPVVVREYLDEVYRPPFKEGMKGPWQTHTRRFLRHKAMIQAARIAFGFTGIYDNDEAERIIEGEAVRVSQPMHNNSSPAAQTRAEQIAEKLGIEKPDHAGDEVLAEQPADVDAQEVRA